MTLVIPGVPATVVNLLQDRTLERVFHDALFPRMLFRAEARPELWPANLGERMIFTRAGLIPVDTTPLAPGADPIPSSYGTEQWAAEARQFAKTIDTHMPTSTVAIASLFLRNTQQLGINACQTMNRLVRDPLYSAYLGGEATVKTAASIADTSLHVTSLNGFTERVDAAGRLGPVTASNVIPIRFSTHPTEPENNVIGVVADNPAEPQGSGRLLLSAGLVTAVAARVAVFATTRSRRQRVGGGATVDALTAANVLTLQDIINAVSYLRTQNVPPHPDGKYHVHMSATSEAQLFADNHWQRMHQSIPNAGAFQELAIGQAVGCYFYRNEEVPTLESTNAARQIANAGGAGGAVTAPEIGAEILNAGGTFVNRVIITGGGAIYEKYLDESNYITEAGVTGKIGEFSIVNNGVALMTRRIRFILRAPLDRMQQIVAQTWSWSGDFPIPSDGVAGNAARYKRAVVVEHG